MPDKVILKTRVETNHDVMVFDQVGNNAIADQMRAKFSILQKLAQTDAAVVTSNDTFNFNLAKLLYQASRKVFEPILDTENGYKKELPEAFLDMLKNGESDAALIYQTLRAITADMLDGAIMFADQTMALNMDQENPPFVISDLLVDLGNCLDQMPNGLGAGEVPHFEFWLEAAEINPDTDFDEGQDLVF